MNRQFDLRALRPRHVLVIFTMATVVFLPFLGVQYALFGPSNRLLSLVTAHARLSADALTAVLMTAWCLLFGVALFAGDRFLRRFMEPKHG